MKGMEIWFRDSFPSRISESRESVLFVGGGLFLDPAVPASFVSSISTANSSVSFPRLSSSRRRVTGHGFLSVSLSVKGSEGFVQQSVGFLEKNGEKSSEEPALDGKEEEDVVVVVEEKKVRVRGAGASAVNTTKHLWAGAVAAMVSR